MAVRRNGSGGLAVAFAALVLCIAVLASFATPARADRLDEIRARGKLIVGVKADYEPFGFRDASGALVGYDVDVAHGLADAVGVPLELVPVTSANRLQKLQGGEVDAIVATLGDTIDRRRLVRMIEPGYYGGGASVLVPATSPIRTWTDLRNRTLCAVQGALWNRLVATRLNATIEGFGSIRDAELGLHDGACEGWLYDEAALQRQLQSPDWAGYRLLPPDFVSPWAIAVASDGRLATVFEDKVAEWLRDGHLLELEEKWKLPPSAYLQDAGTLWSERDAKGDYVCRRQADGSWPPLCRKLDLIEAQKMVGLVGFALMLRDRFGFDITPFYDPYHRDGLLHGLATTLLLAVFVLIGSIAVGCGGALLLERRVPVVTRLIHASLAFMRMTPPLLQLYLVFFGIGGLVAGVGLSLPAFWTAVAVLSFYAGAANAVTLAEAAETVGPGAHRLRRLLRLAHPAIMGASINIVKATAMASAIAVPELVHASTAIAADYGNGSVMMNILLFAYVLIVLAVAHLFTIFERRVLSR